MNEIYLIGLGNPGKKYSKSRHNIGFLVLENLSKKYNSNFLLKDKLKSSYSEFKIKDYTYRLFLPNTFMKRPCKVPLKLTSFNAPFNLLF